MAIVYELGSDIGRYLPEERVVKLRPRLAGPGAQPNYNRCDVVILIDPQWKRVYMGGGEYGYEGLAPF
jgi:hypothetical protein